MSPTNVLQLTPERRYRALLRLWQLHVSASDPDLEQLRHLHQALSAEEALLCETKLDMCLENLQQRMREAVAIGIPVLLPVWAAAHSQALLQTLEESEQ